MNYWEEITKVADRQEAKGIVTYGQRLEDNKHFNDVIEINNGVQEELVDALKYTQHLDVCYRRNMKWVSDMVMTDLEKVVPSRPVRMEIRRIIKQRMRQIGVDV